MNIRKDTSGKKWLRQSSSQWQDDLTLRIELSEMAQREEREKQEKGNVAEFAKEKIKNRSPWEDEQYIEMDRIEQSTLNDNVNTRVATAQKELETEEDRRDAEIDRLTKKSEDAVNASLDLMGSGAEQPGNMTQEKIDQIYEGVK